MTPINRERNAPLRCTDLHRGVANTPVKLIHGGPRLGGRLLRRGGWHELADLLIAGCECSCPAWRRSANRRLGNHRVGLNTALRTHSSA